jgi:hypothetical protein
MECAQASILLDVEKLATRPRSTLTAGIPAGMVEQPAFGIARTTQ